MENNQNNISQCTGKNGCGLYKEATKFGKDNRNKTGHKNLCKECDALLAKQRYELNKEKILKATSERIKADRLNNPEKYRKKSKEYRLKNKGKVNSYQRKYSKTAKGKAVNRVGWAKRRALKSTTADGTITKESLEKLAIKQNNLCKYCGILLCFIDRSNTHLDHVIPISKGGLHSITNVVWSCGKCNMSKGSKLLLSNNV